MKTDFTICKTLKSKEFYILLSENKDLLTSIPITEFKFNQIIENSITGIKVLILDER